MSVWVQPNFALSLVGFLDRWDVTWRVGSVSETDALLITSHYLGPLRSGGAALVIVGTVAGETVAAQVWRLPTSRRLPCDGTWLELSRWCLTPAAGEYAGSRMHRYALKLIKDQLPNVTTLVSYSDPLQGHTGALYRAANWYWAPTWLRLRPPPSGQGAWDGETRQEVKDRWVFDVRRDTHRQDVLRIDDPGAIRHWSKDAADHERRWASGHFQLGGIA